MSQLQAKYRSLGQHKSKQLNRDKDVTSIEDELAQVLLEAHSLADMQVENECRKLGVVKQFPRLPPAHPKYQMVMSLRPAYRRLKDLARKYPDRDHLKKAGAILQQAWDLMC